MIKRGPLYRSIQEPPKELSYLQEWQLANPFRHKCYDCFLTELWMLPYKAIQLRLAAWHPHWKRLLSDSDWLTEERRFLELAQLLVSKELVARL